MKNLNGEDKALQKIRAVEETIKKRIWLVREQAAAKIERAREEAQLLVAGRQNELDKLQAAAPSVCWGDDTPDRDQLRYGQFTPDKALVRKIATELFETMLDYSRTDRR